MLEREQRARQFLPFDAMKGLQKALKAVEERHLKIDKDVYRDGSEEISGFILKTERENKAQPFG